MPDPTKGSWARVEALFQSALALPPDRREAHLLAAAGADAGLLAEVRSLLAAAGHTTGALAVDGGAQVGPALPASEQAAGSLLGPWRIEGLIGRGGMGEVYRARRADGSYEQQVALKLVSSRLNAERFHAERKILARLEHPGIARLLDGGLAADGRPWMAMEYIEGRSLIEHCQAEGCTLDQRLALLREVAAAVAHAHRHLVVHRDLKP